MITFTIALAGKRIEVSALYESTMTFCRDYLAEGPADAAVVIDPADIDFEREKSAREDRLEGIPTRQFSDGYLETLAVYRKIVDCLLEHDIMLFHGSAIAVDGEGYLFTAKSGTGKSTHTRLWRSVFGQRAVMVNDDKPLLRVTEEGVWVCGTPWDGKHHLSENTEVPLKGLCILERGEENEIAPVPPVLALHMLLQQSQRPAEPAKLSRLLSVIDRLADLVPIYRLKCNMDPEAVRVSYEGMQRGKKNQ